MHRLKPLPWAPVVCALVWAVRVLGDEAQKELPEVVVTATRTQTRADDATTSVSVISGQEVVQRDQALVGNALRGSPGVDVTSFGSPGQTTFVTIRGSNPDQVLVLLDGVNVNTPTVGQFDFGNLTTDNLDRVEVLRGSGGALYGSEAIGGVVNVLTKRGEGPFHLLASAEGGSAFTQREMAGINGSHGPFSLSGTVSYLNTDGFQSPNDSYWNFSTVWRGDVDVLPGGTARVFCRYNESRTGLVNFDVFQNRPDPHAYAADNFFLIKGEWEHAPTEALSYRAGLSWVRDNFRYRGQQVDEEEDDELETISSHTPNEQTQAEGQVNYHWPAFALSTIGLEYREQWAELDETDAEDEPMPTSTRANRSIVAVYGQEQVQFLDDTLRGVGGVRYDHYDGFGGQVTTSGSGSYLIRPSQTRLRVGYAQGFRAPTFDELFGPLGNPDLQPETSWEIDAGITQDVFGGRLRIEPTYFYREVHDLIEEITDQLPPVAGVPEEERAQNFASTRMQGVELNSRAQPLSWLTLAANYTYLNHVTATGTLVNRPRHRGAVSAAGHWNDVFAKEDRVTATTLVYLVGRRDSPNPYDADEPFAPASIGGYGRVDVALAYHFGGALAPLAVTATAHNLFNRDYSESIGFPAPGANVLAGVRYGFD
jgi:vitamin B12 transporter